MKTARQEQILKIINSEAVNMQEDLLRRLSDNGFVCTQATLSRDLAEMGIKKVREGGKLSYKLPVKSTPSVLTSGIKSVKLAGNIAVIHCDSGTAGAVCVRIDEAYGHELAGTIAGDDTIFAALETAEAAKKFTAKLKDLLI